MEGEELSADLIVDAMGRRSKVLNWLEAIGARRPIEEAEDSGFIYYTRFFRSKTGLGLMQALGTVEVVRQHLDNPLALTLAQDSMTETRVTPWYRNTVEIDRTRLAGMKAFLEGRPGPP
jgi:hypothetical protein